MTNKLLFFVLLPLCFSGCDMLETHPYDVHITGERELTNKNIQLIENKMQGKKTIRFAMISDTQRWYNSTEDVVKALNARGDIDFVIHGGDQSDFGVTKEFIWMRDIFNKFQMPYVCLLGNHDCLGTGEDAYRAIYGDPNFAFTAGNVRFICLNTNAMEYDYSEPIPDFDYIERQLTERADEFNKTVFCMHARPLCDQFNNNVAKVFQMYVRQFPGLQFCTVAHEHRISASDVFDDGVMYYGSNCMKNRSYLVFTIKPDGYDYEVVEF